MQFRASALSVLATLRLAGADLPIHCLLQDVAGEWDFMVGPPVAPMFSDMVAGIPQCGHHIPNNVLGMLAINPGTEVPEASTSRFRVKMTEDIETTGKVGRHLHAIGEANSTSAAAGNLGGGGFWTMVFDEGFEVRSNDGRSFFGHFDFKPLPNATQKPTHGDRWADIAQYTGRKPGSVKMQPKGDLYSCHCDRTSVGWWHQRNKQGKLESGCFWAKKVQKVGQAVNLVRWRKNEPQTAQNPGLRGGSKKEALVSVHNNAGSAPADDLGRILEVNEVPEDTHRSMFKEVLVPDAEETKPDVPHLGASAGAGALGAVHLAAPIPNGGPVPKAFDWRDVIEDMAPSGTDDLSEQFSQGNCGSCYAFSGAQVLHMRFRIQLFKQHGILYPLELSWKSATSCSPYTEGCQGGFAYLIFKYAAEVGLPLASCDAARLPASLDKTCDWGCYRNNSNIFYAKDYGQTGGFAHGSSEASIMDEIYKNGPVIVSFSAKAIPEFIYNNGKSLKKGTDVMTVIKHDLVDKEPSSTNKKILPWSYTTHSILAVGWGEEKSATGEIIKFWVVRNSWGKGWGVQGYAKIRRGHNDAAIETSAPWVQPDMDRLPPGFLDMAKKYHKDHAAQRAASANAPKTKAVDTNKGGRPAYCKERPDSPDCK